MEERPPHELAATAEQLKKAKLAGFLKARRKALGLTQQSLAQALAVRASHVALLESGRRRPSLRLAARLAAALGLDGKELLLLAYPEARVLLAPAPQPPPKLSRSWQRLIHDPALLARYHVTRRELEALEHLSVLGGTLTTKRLIAILTLARDTP